MVPSRGRQGQETGGQAARRAPSRGAAAPATCAGAAPAAAPACSSRPACHGRGSHQDVRHALHSMRAREPAAIRDAHTSWMWSSCTRAASSGGGPQRRAGTGGASRLPPRALARSCCSLSVAASRGSILPTHRHRMRRRSRGRCRAHSWHSVGGQVESSAAWSRLTDPLAMTAWQRAWQVRNAAWRPAALRRRATRTSTLAGSSAPAGSAPRGHDDAHASSQEAAALRECDATDLWPTCQARSGRPFLRRRVVGVALGIDAAELRCFDGVVAPGGSLLVCHLCAQDRRASAASPQRSRPVSRALELQLLLERRCLHARGRPARSTCTTAPRMTAVAILGAES